MAQQKSILISDVFSQEALLSLQAEKKFDVRRAVQPDLTDTDLENVNALVIRSRTQVDDSLFKRAPKLQLIVTSTSGFDHIDLQCAQTWGVTVMHTPEAHVQSAVEMTWALMMACQRPLLEAHKQVKSGLWQRDLLQGHELFQKTLGIFGYGRIGRRVAKIAQAFEMKVHVYDPYVDEIEFAKNPLVERMSFEETLKTSDIITFHVPKTLETNKMISASEFEFMKRGLILINTSRGSVIDEGPLVIALRQGWVRACGLDVFEKEPLPRTSKLLQFPQVVLSPHLGAKTAEAFRQSSQEAAQKVRDFFRDGSTSDTLPPKEAWYLAPKKKLD